LFARRLPEASRLHHCQYLHLLLDVVGGHQAVEQLLVLSFNLPIN
jgi:hypothetical protein